MILSSLSTGLCTEMIISKGEVDREALEKDQL